MSAVSNVPEAGAERGPVPFDTYRNFVEGLETFRRLGILGTDQYAAAIEDSRTQFVEMEPGTMPLLVPLQYSNGYDIERCERLTGKPNVSLLAMPTIALGKTVTVRGDFSETAILVESTVDDKRNRESLPGRFDLEVGELVVQDFVDSSAVRRLLRVPELRGYSNGAWMAMYYGVAKPVRAETEGDSRDLLEAFHSMEGASLRPQDGHALYGNQEFGNNPDIKDEVWDLFKDRFSSLGKQHPVSMEDTKEAFEEMLADEGTFVALRFQGGKVSCAGVFLHNLEACYWLSPSFISQIDNFDSADAQNIYFEGMAAKSIRERMANLSGTSLMEGLIKFHSELAQRAGLTYRLFFECTNRSSTFIPKYVKKFVDESGAMKFDELGVLDMQNYWYMTQK